MKLSKPQKQKHRSDRDQQQQQCRYNGLAIDLFQNVSADHFSMEAQFQRGKIYQEWQQLETPGLQAHLFPQSAFFERQYLQLISSFWPNRRAVKHGICTRLSMAHQSWLQGLQVLGNPDPTKRGSAGLQRGLSTEKTCRLLTCQKVRHFPQHC